MCALIMFCRLPKITLKPFHPTANNSVLTTGDNTILYCYCEQVESDDMDGVAASHMTSTCFSTRVSRTAVPKLKRGVV